MTGQLTLDIRLRDDATFANYVGEGGARLAAANGFVLVWGGPETGRSHLLQACCHQAQGAGESAIYLEELRRHPAEALRGLESVAVVCIDGIDAVLGDEAWEMALFDLINAIKDADGMLVVSALTPATSLTIGLDDLRSRLLAAGAIQTDRLSDTQKLAVLRQRAGIRGLAMSDEVGRFIMGRVPRSMRSLISLLEQLEVETLARQKKVTIPLVKEALGI